MFSDSSLPNIPASFPLEDPKSARIIKAFTGPSHGLRTIGGIARTTGLTSAEVESYLQANPQVFKLYPLALSGTSVYQLNPELSSILIDWAESTEI